MPHSSPLPLTPVQSEDDDEPAPPPSKTKRRSTFFFRSLQMSYPSHPHLPPPPPLSQATPTRKQRATAPAETVTASPDLSSPNRRRLNRKSASKVTSPNSYETNVRVRHTIFSDDEQKTDDEVRGSRAG